MSSPPTHIPKQALALLTNPGKVAIYESTGGLVTAQFAAHNLSLIPPIPANAIIHDNASGSGTVSRAILSTKPPPQNITIHATDIDQAFLDALQSDTTHNSWPIRVSNQNSNTLSFENDFFTHSITNIGILFFSPAGASEIHRTLQPAGTAIVNCWSDITWLAPIAATSFRTRGARPPLPPVNWQDGTHLRKVMLDAGFKEEKLRIEKSEAWAKTGDLRGWAERTWAFLGGLGGWKEGDEKRWDEAVDMLVEGLLEQEGTKRVGDEVWMRASQWVAVATK
ncbi:hypothetical protein FB567DRAFT_530309 [Paraphoma chrysanthemicola]|uniref:Methyltransferase domain-containing protein n=1 Tax=Paraphoma chrysanthemicola TaxID=798071 RepID=A0A8K0R185_9PLEO|nr:hypothetical protein FB567DRAFT_530309 [Paraphoma chrysanthemicola]